MDGVRLYDRGINLDIAEERVDHDSISSISSFMTLQKYCLNSASLSFSREMAKLRQFGA